MDVELRQLIDRQQIAEVALRYAKAADSRDGALMRACFMPDGVLSLPSLGEFVGHDAIAGALPVLAALDVTQHAISNQLIQLDGDLATMESYCVATHIKHGHPGGDVFTGGGIYLDKLLRSPSGWLIAHRTLNMLWSTGNPAMLFKQA